MNEQTQEIVVLTPQSVRVDSTVTTTETGPEEWTCRSWHFGFSKVGKTAEEAVSAVRDAIEALVVSYNDKDALRRFLDAKRVRYTLHYVGFVPDEKWI